MIRERLKINCVLALTATATVSTLTSTISTFAVPPSGMLVLCLPSNVMQIFRRSFSV